MKDNEDKEEVESSRREEGREGRRPQAVKECKNVGLARGNRSL